MKSLTLKFTLVSINRSKYDTTKFLFVTVGIREGVKVLSLI